MTETNMRPSDDTAVSQDIADKLREVSNRRREASLFDAPQSVQFSGQDVQMSGQPAHAETSAMTTPPTNWKTRIRSIPVVGSLIAWFYAIVRFNTIRRQLEEHIEWRVQAEGRRIDGLRQEMEAQFHGVDGKFHGVDGKFQEVNLRFGNSMGRLEALNIGSRLNRLDALDIARRLNAFDMINIANRLNHIEATLRAIQERDRERDNRIAALIQEFRQLQAARHVANPAEQPATSGEVADTGAKADLDSFYVEFEGLFRGSREDIQARQKVYLPHVAHLAGDDAALVVDIGCGRGEWIELLRQQRIKAIGIDMNRAMVDLCRERGLDALCIDAIAYLDQREPGSVAAITGFHVIEHLPFEQLIALFDAALRALRPDGLIIFETPNPENMIVGTCNFYFDPTHRHPIAPALAEFMARQRGFAHAEILRLNAFPEAARITTEDSEVARRVNHAFYGPQDYAVLAWKTHAG